MSAEKCIHLHRWSRPTPGQDRFEVKYLRDTHKPEAILLSLTPLVFERFLPSLTLWLSPNCCPNCLCPQTVFDKTYRRAQRKQRLARWRFFAIFAAFCPELTAINVSSRMAKCNRFFSTDEKRVAMDAKYPLGRAGTPTDLANMAALLLSPDSSWGTGQVIAVDGGMSAIRR